MRNIHIIHASRGRASQAETTYRNWSNHLRLGDSYTIATEADQFADYRNLPILITPSKTAISAFNLAAIMLEKKFKDDDIIVALSDDFPMPCDLEVLRYITPQDKLLKTFDGVQKWIVTLPIMGAKYYFEKGYIYPPAYSHMFADTQLTHEAEIANKLEFKNDITIEHKHYSTGNGIRDVLNVKNDATWNQGMEVYLEWIKGKPLPNSIEAQPHVNWIKSHAK